MMRYLFVIFLCCLPFSICAKELPEAEAKEQAPVSNGVTVYENGDNTIEEQRVKGFLYSVKVTPKRGAAYHLVNSNGDNTVLKVNHPQTKVPSWTVFSW